MRRRISFEDWKCEVNREVLRIAQVSCDDIGDYDFRIAYDHCEDPKKVARRALRAADFPFPAEN